MNYFLDDELQQEKRDIDNIQLELSFSCNNPNNADKESNSSIVITKKNAATTKDNQQVSLFTEDQYKQLDEQLRNVSVFCWSILIL